ncbi:MAG: organic solvent tolerance ABC transporter substrate-binding protein [Planctomycetes bacterium RIFCSPHIGHO2_12_39_6]|nr:MAG: organic solvent tolerance ABC transporter substrate-binding protein [Planctomycetes bacterium RIFCSPLOWO2_12_38_17]OHC04152.1 MAG: organic solvent tolerance ABC transporter substrate-binding protein [Planctomycetes bacterium RIFCSPHIGHO2_12_39_6]
MRYKRVFNNVILVVCLTSCFFVFGSSILFAGDPGKLVMDTIDKGLVVLKEPSLKGNDKVNERRQKLWETISHIFNFEEMSKRALGQHWKKRSDEEKKEFVGLFTNILKDAYIGKTDAYSGEKVILMKERVDKEYATVQTKFILNTGSELVVDYNMLNNSGEWKIYDVIIEGVSLVNNYRSQFNSILIKSTYNELVQRIKEKKANG